MSLYIGNLSSCSRQDELQHVFQKFGRCNVRLKDGYGFVVYEYPPNAEKALRALQKKYICGESLTLTWSNKQPRPFKRLARSLRSYQPQQGRDSLRGRDYVKGKLGSNNQDYRMSAKQSDGISRRRGSTGKHDKEATYVVDDTKDNLGKEHHGCREDFLDEGDRLEPDPANGDRWGKQLHDEGNENGVENDIEFDRYEPYQGYDRKYDDEIHQRTYTGGSPDLQSPPKDIGTDHIDEVKLKYSTDAKFQVTCYRCGGLGHKMRNCPQENTSLRKSTRLDCRHDNGINRRGGHESELENFGSRSWEKLRSSGDAIPKGQLKNDLKSSGLGKHQRPISSGSSPVGKETDESKKKQYSGNKRSMKEIESLKRHGTKKARRSFSSPSNSDYPASPSCSASQSSEHVIRSHSHSKSRSASSRAGSLLSESSSSSTAHCSRSKISKSSARSISHTPLSVSLGQLLPSSSNKAHFNMKGSSDNATSPESDAILIEKGLQIEVDNCLEDAKLENRMVAANNENTAPHSRTVIEIENDHHPLENDHEDRKIASGSLYEVTNPSTSAAEKSTVDAGSFSPKGFVELDCQNSDELMTEHVPVPLTNLDSEPPVGSCSVHSTSLSSEELCMVLKHYYGLDLQGENQMHLPAEAYFGSARLWPWEVIYYRRLKKGPISIENYARRVDQNREFGIVDKYIRSSSGWEELGQVNP